MATVSVLDEIIASLISPPLITEITKPQALYDHKTVRAIIEQVSQSSVMRLDPLSMDKLWDLITMVFKWQTTLSPDLMMITLRHLYEIETYVINPDIQLQLHRVQNLIDNFNKILDQRVKRQVRQDVLAWLQRFNIRVSLLLRIGLQNNDGSFISNTCTPMAQSMLKNLGESIYSVAETSPDEPEGKPEDEREIEEGPELKFFVDQILGTRNFESTSREGGPTLKLSIGNEGVDNEGGEQSSSFNKIDVTIEENKLENIFKDLDMSDGIEISSLNDDLLEMINSENV